MKRWVSMDEFSEIEHKRRTGTPSFATLDESEPTIWEGPSRRVRLAFTPYVWSIIDDAAKIAGVTTGRFVAWTALTHWEGMKANHDNTSKEEADDTWAAVLTARARLRGAILGDSEISRQLRVPVSPNEGLIIQQIAKQSRKSVGYVLKVIVIRMLAADIDLRELAKNGLAKRVEKHDRKVAAARPKRKRGPTPELRRRKQNEFLLARAKTNYYKKNPRAILPGPLIRNQVEE